MSLPPGLVALSDLSFHSLCFSGNTYEKSSLHAYLLSGTIERDVRPLKVNVIQRSDLHDIFGKFFCRVELTRSPLSSFAGGNDEPFMRKTV